MTEDPTVGLLRRNPVVLFALVLSLPAMGTAVAAWAEGQTVVAIIASAVGVLIATLTPIVRAAVTPVADPRDRGGEPLVPVSLATGPLDRSTLPGHGNPATPRAPALDFGHAPYGDNPDGSPRTTPRTPGGQAAE